MSEIIRRIDLRNMSEQNNYFVVFAARSSTGGTGLPGHAFVVWGVENSSASMSSQQAFGFYPDSSSSVGVLLSDIRGSLVDEATTFDPSTELTARLIAQVNSPVFAASQAQIGVWRTNDYNLYAQNCIHFSRSVAIAIGLFPPTVGTLELPHTYMERLIEQASRGTIGHFSNGTTRSTNSLSISVHLG